MLNILVREYRCSGGTDTVNPAAGNRCSGTGRPHLSDCYLRVYSLNGLALTKEPVKVLDICKRR